MASIKKNEMKAMDEKTARQRITELKIELMKLRAQVAIGTNIESPGRVKAAKRNIAKLLTHIGNIKNKDNKNNIKNKNIKNLENKNVKKSENKMEVSRKE